MLRCHAANAYCLPAQVASLDRRFALPALLPLITPDLHLTEQQGALLTAGYAVSAPSYAIGFALLGCMNYSLHFATTHVVLPLVHSVVTVPVHGAWGIT